MSKDHHGWTGSRVRRARAHFGPMLPLPCARCGLPVDPDQAWHVGHQEDRALGGGHELANLWPEHQLCSTSAGGKLGAALRGARPPVVKIARVRRREW